MEITHKNMMLCYLFVSMKEFAIEYNTYATIQIDGEWLIVREDSNVDVLLARYTRRDDENS